MKRRKVLLFIILLFIVASSGLAYQTFTKKDDADKFIEDKVAVKDKNNKTIKPRSEDKVKESIETNNIDSDDKDTSMGDDNSTSVNLPRRSKHQYLSQKSKNNNNDLKNSSDIAKDDSGTKKILKKSNNQTSSIDHSKDLFTEILPKDIADKKTPNIPISTPSPKPGPDTPPPDNPTKDDDNAANRIIKNLKTSNNDNVAQFINDDGQIRTVLWAKGIKAPRLGNGGDFRRIDETYGGNRFITYSTNGYRSDFVNSGWYDTDKSPNSGPIDINLCFGAVASNQLHWWMNYHEDNIKKFLAKTDYVNKINPANRGTLRDLTTFKDSFKNPQDSRFFTMMKTYFGHNSEGYYVDPLVDMFINGHKPKANGGFNDPDWTHDFQMDSRGGFFHEVFGKKNLTRRLGISTASELSRELKKAFQDGEIVGLTHSTAGSYAHVITSWGAEYDLSGKLVGIYITDSDDHSSPDNGMKRYSIREVNGRPVFSNNVSNLKSGSKIEQISTLNLSEKEWENFLNK